MWRQKLILEVSGSESRISACRHQESRSKDHNNFHVFSPHYNRNADFFLDIADNSKVTDSTVQSTDIIQGKNIGNLQTTYCNTAREAGGTVLEINAF